MKIDVGQNYHDFIVWLEMRTIHLGGGYSLSFAWPESLYNGMLPSWSGGWKWGRVIYPYGNWALYLGPIAIDWE